LFALNQGRHLIRLSAVGIKCRRQAKQLRFHCISEMDAHPFGPLGSRRCWPSWHNCTHYSTRQTKIVAILIVQHEIINAHHNSINNGDAHIKQ